ncbi:MAG: fructosamine kinase family protein [Acidimicrobiales bacterium]
MDVVALVSDAIGTAVLRADPLGGGDVADAYRIELHDGTRVFAKTKADAAPDFFETEALGLRWLGEAGVVPVPEVLHVGVDAPLLVLEWIEPGDATETTEVELGHALAALHQAGAPCFGRADRRATGSRGLPNEPCDTWAEFYGTNRLLPLARLAADSRALSRDTIADLESIAARLEQLGGPPEPPARLHGDLWAGNRMIGADGRSWLIDPAAHGGHREFDLSMMLLFGGYGSDCFAAYDDTYPLADRWEDRVALHQLAPLAVHAIKFGGSYGPATARAAARFR